jgi:hypothetical protein
MRRQPLFMIPAFLGALAACFAIGYLPLRASRALGASSWHAVSAQGLTVDLPAGTAAPVLEPGDPWSATEFTTPVLGTLRIAREQPRGDLQPALRNWFNLPGDLDAPISYAIGRQPAQARPVHAFGPSGLQVRRQGRLLVAVCVFDLNGSRYWVQARTTAASRAALSCFHRVLLSMRDAEGAGVDPRLKAELSVVEAGLTRGIAPDLVWIAFIPMGVMLIVMTVVLGVGRMSGKAPKPPEGLGARYLLPSVEVLLAFQMQRKYFDATIAVTEDRLVLYTFGTPFLTVPLGVVRSNAVEGFGWFGPPFLEISLTGNQDYRKMRRLYARWMGKTRLRIYTADISRLRVALGA